VAVIDGDSVRSEGLDQLMNEGNNAVLFILPEDGRELVPEKLKEVLSHANHSTWKKSQTLIRKAHAKEQKLNQPFGA
jgi:hypothetical protein